MTIIRSISSAFSRLSDQMMGQDVERASLAKEHGTGSDFAAVAQVHSASQGVSPLGFGR